MTTDSQYSWPRFFMELADKLLAFKDDRQALIATLQHVYAELSMDLPSLDSGGIPTDIDRKAMGLVCGCAGLRGSAD